MSELDADLAGVLIRLRSVSKLVGGLQRRKISL